MQIQKSFYWFLILLVTAVHSQSLSLLKGKIIAPIKDINTIEITNLRSESVTNSDFNGNFSLFVMVSDTLFFKGLQIISKKIKVTEYDLGKKLFVVNLEPKTIQLEEVTINQYKNINAVSLGILQKPAKVYTPAERKLATATRSYPTLGLGNFIGVSAGLDPLLNWMSGRTKLLKKELIVEKKELLIKKIENQFEFAYFTNKLKIPQELVKGFWYFAVEDPKLVEAINNKNKTMAQFVFSDLARTYLNAQKIN